MKGGGNKVREGSNKLMGRISVNWVDQVRKRSLRNVFFFEPTDQDNFGDF